MLFQLARKRAELAFALTQPGFDLLAFSNLPREDFIRVGSFRGSFFYP